ncbi:MAG: FAD-binding dehydrogenase [Leptospiraceae bacterium]|nr:FAD-binding dehydrogenase [Leptospiraceae bacterium]MCK6382294.1 FAD-binding dehydrogenase [Leptospiraceae bacterium]NUM41195.1 FAD-binding dehydrogenase [Leptospiraceae bacterium]
MQADVVIVGGGLAGIVAALDLLDNEKKVILIDRDKKENFGGLAKLSFGGVFMVNTPNQRRLGIKDSIELALSDWNSCANFGNTKDYDLPKKWAELYVNQSQEDIYKFFTKRKVGFFPVVHWVERGMFKPGNSVPRFHMVWGTGKGLIDSLVTHLYNHKNVSNLNCIFEHRVTQILTEKKIVAGCIAREEGSGRTIEVRAEKTMLASGGIAGDLIRVRKNWDKSLGTPPEVLLNGSHKYALGDMHDMSGKLGARLTHLEKMWNYAAGVHHPIGDKELHGLSLVPPKSALWLNFEGKRIGPIPLVTGFDTKFLVEEICKQKKKYSWQILNWKIAVKELAVSGSEYNEAIRDKKIFAFLKQVKFGNKKLVEDLTNACEDFVVAGTVSELVEKMNKLNGDSLVKLNLVEKEIQDWDSMIERGEKFHNDDQLRRLSQLRNYGGDKARTCSPQKILDKDAMPLIAIREFILTRKSLGGIQTDLESRVLNNSGKPIEGLYAIGETAGFGGGGLHGEGALEGTFLGGCAVSARAAVRSILGKKI